jgi:hypothetical protein
MRGWMGDIFPEITIKKMNELEHMNLKEESIRMRG